MALATGAPAQRRPRLGGLASRASSAPFLTATVVCFALAALSAAILPTVPSYDPWSWIVWGREAFDPHLNFTVAGGPSWKPLPVIFTSIYGLFGGAAPTLWVITSRTGGLLACVAAYRLASRLTARDGSGWGPVCAGVLAAVGVGLTQEWAYYMLRGTSEPILVGATLWAVDQHLEGRYRSAFVLGVAASLIRPEWWPFIGLYAIWLWLRSDRAGRLLILAGLFAIPFFWFGPPWVGTGQPLIAASHAKDYNGHLGSNPFVEVLRRGADLQVVPSLVFALIAIALAWRRDRDWLVLGFGAATLAWWVLVVAMTLDGYPGLERFYLPAAALTSVLAGVGVVRVGSLAGSRLGSRSSDGDPGSETGRVSGGGRWSASTVAGVVVAVLVAISIPFTISRIDTARAAKPIADRAVTRLDQLTAAVAAVGGHDGVYPCKDSFAAVNHGVQTALAWKLHVTLEKVGTSMRHPGVMFVGPHDSIDGAPAAISRGLNRIQFITRVGSWKMYRVWRAGHPLTCVGK